VDERDLSNPAAEITLFQQVRQIENVTALHGDGWAFSQPELWSASAHGVVATAMVSAPTIGEAIDVLRAYGHVRAPFFHIARKERGGTVHLEYELTVALDEPQWRPMIEIAMMAVRSLVQASLGRTPDEMVFSFAAPKPSYDAKVRAALGAHVRYDAKITRVELPKAWMDIPSTGADSALHRHALGELQTALARLNDPVDLRAQVERLLQTMPDGRLGANDVARTLGVSRRTLARRLMDAGTQFRDLLDDEMKSRAQKLLAAKTFSRDAIAERLGYRDPTSFSRACRRWFG
jgi:AraC-like DNA-binding protein